MPETDALEAITVIERIQRELKNITPQILEPRYTISGGVTTFIKLPAQVDEVLQITDRLMHMAKAHGKNCAMAATYMGFERIGDIITV